MANREFDETTVAVNEARAWKAKQTEEKVRRLLLFAKANPEIGSYELARRFGIGKDTVARLLKEAKI
jgi:predicted HTH transcriptional regulator